MYRKKLIRGNFGRLSKILFMLCIASSLTSLFNIYIYFMSRTMIQQISTSMTDYIIVGSKGEVHQRLLRGSGMAEHANETKHAPTKTGVRHHESYLVSNTSNNEHDNSDEIFNKPLEGDVYQCRDHGNSSNCDNLENNAEYKQEKQVNLSWIPLKFYKPADGPHMLRLRNGKMVRYTNFSFYPLTTNSSYMLNNKNLCHVKGELTILIMVHTAVSHFHRRQVLRETWANKELFKDINMRILFLLGRPKNESIQVLLVNESKQYQDLVQGDFIDDYHNLTHKGVLGFRWITENCRNAKFILKIDDDVYVNIFRVVEELLPIYRRHPHQIMCPLEKNGKIFHKNSKWAVSSDYFPDLQAYPVSYCLGPFVLIPGKFIPRLFEAAKRTPYFWVDDVYLFGILVELIQGSKFFSLRIKFEHEIKSVACFSGNEPCKLLMAFAWKDDTMHKYWNATMVQYRELVKKYANPNFIIQNSNSTLLNI
ncbi:hypothetical protein CHS0354_008380 [Potamilus streckersoni]|uniref:Hexosyltransferase n=1 Tax=Potamilus streckersoni TaxID=2493646 RepID=A0AAE0VGD8_9BIVA|nr:hypothetical protein CHS0354_008380 [Potamilus streckersoni]